LGAEPSAKPLADAMENSKNIEYAPVRDSRTSSTFYTNVVVKPAEPFFDICERTQSS